ncbi:MAG TPA: cation:proton antiporter [Planctomycetaceae bacterium]|nr:cation:proton antiporter [Planctomycetaceae bacterium]
MTTSAATAPSRAIHRTTITYLTILVLAVFAFLGIRYFGEGLTAPASAVATVEKAAKPARPEILLHVLITLAVVAAAGLVLGSLCARIGQPPVIGEVIGGILLGPSFLGALSPAAMHFVLPTEVAPSLGVLAQIGVILYMFQVGLELNGELLRERAHQTVAISHASIVAPFLIGATFALYLYPRLSTSEVPFTSFALFLGVSMSITAFPVLARILTDLRISRTPLGIMALTCAATDDVTAWCLLAFVVGVAQAQIGGALVVLALTVVYIAGMYFVVRPLIARWLSYAGEQPVTHSQIAIGLIALLVSALATEWIGIHAIFGAFLLGAVIPHDSKLAQTFSQKIDTLTAVLFLPAFFAFTGMRTQIGLVSGIEQWLICGAIIVIATLGKFGGALLAARCTGTGWRQASAIGALMNTRGLMELIVLNIGLDLGVITPTLFAMMVLMAIVTTTATSPILRRILRRDETGNFAMNEA